MAQIQFVGERRHRSSTLHSQRSTLKKAGGLFPGLRQLAYAAFIIVSMLSP